MEGGGGEGRGGGGGYNSQHSYIGSTLYFRGLLYKRIGYIVHS